MTPALPWVRCRAKVNTVLVVRGRRPDGYHELDTEFLSLQLHDRLFLEPSEGFTLEVMGETGAGVPVAGNLVLEAAARLQAALGSRSVPGARFVLEKVIPVAAGLGGGSSDAAGALVGLVRLHGLQPRAGLLAQVALEVGSDVPYFLMGGRCRGRSRGEVLDRLPDRPDAPVLLVHPRMPLSTAQVFAAHASLAGGKAPGACATGETSLTMRKTDTSFSSGSWWRSDELQTHNDLWPAASEVAPELANLRRWVQDRLPEASLGLSGSGPTLFAVLPHESADGDRMATRLGRLRRPDVDILLTRTVGAREYRESRFGGWQQERPSPPTG